MKDGLIELVHKSIERAENGPCDANSRVGDYTQQKNKVDEVFYTLGMLQMGEVDGIMNIIVPN